MLIKHWSRNEIVRYMAESKDDDEEEVERLQQEQENAEKADAVWLIGERRAGVSRDQYYIMTDPGEISDNEETPIDIDRDEQDHEEWERRRRLARLQRDTRTQRMQATADKADKARSGLNKANGAQTSKRKRATEKTYGQGTSSKRSR
jgi:hypothetical protein